MSLRSPLTTCLYDYDAIRQTRRWVPWIKHALLLLHLNGVARRLRGHTSLSELTGGWNSAQAIPATDMRRVNVGCGQANYQGYINLDIVPWRHLHACSWGQRLPFKTESIDEVLCTDVIEHLDHEAGQQMVAEVQRILRHGGRFILVTPDLENIFRAYRSHFATHDRVVQHLLGDARDHRYLYTIPLLSAQLRAAGLNVTRTIAHWGPIWAHMVILAEKP